MKSSWIGEIPNIPRELFAVDWVQPEYSKEFAAGFNDDPIKTIEKLKKIDSRFAEAEYPARYIFACQMITPISVYKYIFSEQYNSLVFPRLVEYFHTINATFLHTAEAAYYLLGRVAFPRSMAHFKIMIQAFSTTYLSSNPYLNVTVPQLSTLVVVLILTSLIPITKEVFLKKTDSVPIAEETKATNYDLIQKMPIPITLSFLRAGIKPTLELTGLFKKTGHFGRKVKKVVISKWRLWIGEENQNIPHLKKICSVIGLKINSANFAKDGTITFKSEAIYNGKPVELTYIPTSNVNYRHWRDCLNYMNFCETIQQVDFSDD